jgi:hypothetical protein
MKKLFTIIIIIFIFPGCISFMEKAGQVLDGSAFAEKRIALFNSQDMTVTVTENKSDEKFIIIALKKYPMMKLRASYPDENGVFHISLLEYIGGHLQGWNEYSHALIGSGSFLFGETAVFSADREIEKVEIISGRIHLLDSRITGNEALIALRNRRDRIAETARWMLSLDAPRGQSIRQFVNYWKPILFPELVAKRKRPQNWKQDGDVFQRAEDIRWNTGYTLRVFPEQLRSIRDSGTLLRDWEEALYWLYMDYEWDNILNLLSRETVLQKKK